MNVLEPYMDLILSVVYLVGVLMFLTIFALLAVWLERKVSAHLQDRLGPMMTGGWHGWSQTIADALKLILKEDIIPAVADRKLFRLAPYLVFIGSLAGFAVLPFAHNLIGSDINIGVYYVIAITSLVVIGILMAGWASNNKWALYGAMRAAAQMVSYEIPVALSLLIPVLMAGTMSMQTIVQNQAGGFWNWYVFQSIPFSLVAFVIYFWASLAEVNRTPFDIPEAESELVAGFHVEYSGMRFAVFFLAEYGNMFVVSAIAATVFLGGWHAPFTFLDFIPGPIWFIGKSMGLVLVQLWLRWTLPRLRVDQLMHVCWKIFLPFSFANLLLVGLWVVLKG
ncbi:NADH-quinone oxidoreductase subunit H [candidate division LCP-89 bacterium B3_LCP]|uniref:NADH-quinone oxidoreductase subunit H n=1 Tax=candidate division LCP-89 bacterium B3_LCP TaxID=2012998 RepID=A0A532V5T7_UNCL8|nr:MAG: NADH-quinone oxidoreductase subunit H [candidate division LCP-89 bacterium B3_LCP]